MSSKNNMPENDPILREDVQEGLLEAVGEYLHVHGYEERLKEVEIESQLFQKYVDKMLKAHNKHADEKPSFHTFCDQVLGEIDLNDEEEKEQYKDYTVENFQKECDVIEKELCIELERIFNCFPLGEDVYVGRMKEEWFREIEERVQMKNSKFFSQYLMEVSSHLKELFLKFESRLKSLYHGRFDARILTLIKASQETGKLFFLPKERVEHNKELEIDYQNSENKLREEFIQEAEETLPLYITHPFISDFHEQIKNQYGEYIQEPEIKTEIFSLYGESLAKYNTLIENAGRTKLFPKTVNISAEDINNLLGSMSLKVNDIMKVQIYQILRQKASASGELPTYFVINSDEVFNTKVNELIRVYPDAFQKYSEEISNDINQYIINLQSIYAGLNYELYNKVQENTPDEEIRRLLDMYKEESEHQKYKQYLILNARILRTIFPDKPFYIPKSISFHIFDLQDYTFKEYGEYLTEEVLNGLKDFYDDCGGIFESIITDFRNREKELAELYKKEDTIYDEELGKINMEFQKKVGEEYMLARNKLDDFFKSELL